MKAEVDALDINKLVNVPTALNNSNTKVDGLGVGKLKTVPMDQKKKKLLKTQNLTKENFWCNYFTWHKSI